MTPSTVAPALAQLPNTLTIVRFALIPAFVVVVLASPDGQTVAGALIFGVAGLTDQIDGWLARRWRVESEFGKLADPLADRLMIDAAVVLLWLAERLPWPALAIILARDAVLVGGSRFAIRRGYSFSVSFLGKTATWVLYAALVSMLFTHTALWPVALFWIGVGLAVGAGAAYVVSARRSLQ